MPFFSLFLPFPVCISFLSFFCAIFSYFLLFLRTFFLSILHTCIFCFSLFFLTSFFSFLFDFLFSGPPFFLLLCVHYSTKKPTNSIRIFTVLFLIINFPNSVASTSLSFRFDSFSANSIKQVFPVCVDIFPPNPQNFVLPDACEVFRTRVSCNMLLFDSLSV